MISATEAKALAAKLTLEDVEDAIRIKAGWGQSDTTFPVARWNKSFDPVLIAAGYTIRLGGMNDEVVIVEW